MTVEEKIAQLKEQLEIIGVCHCGCTDSDRWRIEQQIKVLEVLADE